MHFNILLALMAAPALVTATLDPATSNTKGYKPKSLNCSGKPAQNLPTSHLKRKKKKTTPDSALSNAPAPSLQHPKSPTQSKLPNARTTLASRGPKPSPSSKQTTSTTRATARRTEPAARILALRPLPRSSRLTRTTGYFTGVMRGVLVALGLGVSKIRRRGSVDVRIRMGRSSLGVIAAFE